MNAKDKKILIIDDSPEDIEVVIENLKNDYAVLVGTDGQKGLDLAANEPRPDVILLDVMMPQMDGYETCRRLKENPETQDIDVIFVSGKDTTEEKLAGYDAGGSDYLIKPVQPEELVRKVKANTSRWMHRQLVAQETFAWQDGYAAFTVSPSALPRVLEYIANQEEHHRRMTFEEELKALLNKHGIEYDERYISA